jgi:hypothetical protein
LPGAIVANIYYIQPLLSAIANDFHVFVATVGVVAMVSQLGTAIAMLVFVPLGGHQGTAKPYRSPSHGSHDLRDIYGGREEYLAVSSG